MHVCTRELHIVWGFVYMYMHACDLYLHTYVCTNLPTYIRVHKLTNTMSYGDVKLCLSMHDIELCLSMYDVELCSNFYKELCLCMYGHTTWSMIMHLGL
jgi:hypothetical protein